MNPGFFPNNIKAAFDAREEDRRKKHEEFIEVTQKMLNVIKASTQLSKCKYRTR